MNVFDRELIKQARAVDIPPIAARHSAKCLASLAPRDNRKSFEEWLKDHPEPSLAELVERYGGYSRIPPDAWADVDRRMGEVEGSLSPTTRGAAVMTPLGHHSLKLAAKGIRTFPDLERDKKPAIAELQKRATTDSNMIIARREAARVRGRT
jgi:hypothetical protein